MQCKHITIIFLCFLFGLSSSDTYAQEKKTIILSKITDYRLQNKKKDTVYINLLNTLGWELKYSNFDSVTLLSTEAFELSKKLNYKKGQAKALLSSSFSEIITRKNSEKTLKKIDLAIELSTEIKADTTLLSAYNIKAIYKSYEEDYEGAYKVYRKALIHCQKIDNPLLEMKIYTNLATLFSILGDSVEAIKYYVKALDISNTMNEQFWIGVVKSNLGYLYIKTNEFDKADTLLDESIQIFTQENKNEWLAFAYLTKGNLLLEKKYPEEALAYFDLSQALLKNLIDEKRKQDLLLGYAKCYQQLNNQEKSENFAQEGLLLSTKTKYQLGIASFSEILYQLNKIKGNQELALLYLEKFKNITDSTSLQSKKNALALLNAKTNFQKEQYNLKQENQKKIKKQQTYIAFTVFAVFIAILIAFYAYRNNKIITNLNHQLEEKTEILESSEKTLKYANETQEKLFSIISHDLKSPINALKNLLLLIKNGNIKPNEFLNFAPKLYNDVDAMSFTLNNLLSWSKSQMNGFIHTPINFKLSEKINESIQLLQENANQKNISIINKVPKDADVYCDNNQFNLIVRNLLNNGIKFTTSGGEITISALPKNNFWQVTLEDNGVGMTSKVKNKLFKPDSALQSTYGTNKEKGTGLGLLLCKEMVENNGGKIHATSIKDKGSIFYFTVPKAKESLSI
jgi:signal transduction histidine kinase